MSGSYAILLVIFFLVLQPARGASVTELLQQAEQLIDKEQLAKAEVLLNQAARTEPENAEVIYRLGYVQYRLRKLGLARQNLQRVIKQVPPAYSSRYFLGRIALLESKPREAIEWFDPILQSNQIVFDTAAQVAGAYASVGESQKAIAALRTAILQTPWDGSLYYKLGQIYQRSGQADMAREEFRNSSRLKNLNREDVEILMHISELLRESKNQEAVQNGAKILDRENADPSTVIAVGVLYGTAGLPLQALSAFESAAARDANLFQAHFNKGLALLKLNRTAESLPPLQRATELLPQSADANMTFGLAQVMNQRYREAIDPLSRAWRMDSSNPRVGSLLATAYLRAGEPNKALPILRSVVDSSKEPTSLLLMIEVLNGVQDTDGALDAAKVAAARFPTIPQAQLALGQQLIRAGRYQDARPAFEAALRLTPGLPEAELGVADTLQKAGEHAPALEHYQQAKKSSATELAATLGEARSLAALRRLDEAAIALETAIPRQPSNATLHLELSRIYARAGKPELANQHAKIAEQLKANP